MDAGSGLCYPRNFRKIGASRMLFAHQVGLTIEEQRRRILEYVDEHNSVTRREAANLLARPADDSIYRLLKRMVKDEILKQEGEGAATRYMRA